MRTCSNSAGGWRRGGRLRGLGGTSHVGVRRRWPLGTDVELAREVHSGHMGDKLSFRIRQSRCCSNTQSPGVAQGVELKHASLDQRPHLLAVPVFSQ